MDYKIGYSKDTHRFTENRKLILGGIEIEHHLGLAGHSDADCVLHAVTEAIIGALGLGDIGMHFPDTDNKYKNMNSEYFLVETRKLMAAQDYEINNLDISIYLEKPFLRPYIEMIKENLARILDINKCLVNVKATRGEGIGFIGRGEGISSDCIVLLKSVKGV